MKYLATILTILRVYGTRPFDCTLALIDTIVTSMLHDKAMIIAFCDNVIDSSLASSLFDLIGSLAFSFHELKALITYLVDPSVAFHMMTLIKILQDLYSELCPIALEEKFLVASKSEVLCMSSIGLILPLTPL